MWNMQCNMEFEYQLSICSGTKENHRKPWWNSPVTGSSECKLTSSQQSSIKYAIPNISLFLCSCFIEKYLQVVLCSYDLIKHQTWIPNIVDLCWALPHWKVCWVQKGNFFLMGRELPSSCGCNRMLKCNTAFMYDWNVISPQKRSITSAEDVVSNKHGLYHPQQLSLFTPQGERVVEPAGWEDDRSR
jgi:hypothetical protein